MVRNKVWSIWWVQIWSTLIYCHREFEYMQSCKWEPIAGQNQVLILPFFSVLLLYHFTIVIISDKKILYSFIKEICSQPFSSYVLLWVLNMWLVVTDFVNQFHVDLLPVLHQPFNSLKWFTFNFSLQFPSTIQQTGIGVLKCVGKKLSSWSNTK